MHKSKIYAETGKSFHQVVSDTNKQRYLLIFMRS